MTSRHPALRSVELHILLSIVDRPRHGYGILQDAEAHAGGHPGFEIPTLYRALRRLESEGLIQAADAPDPTLDERREYWEATELGRVVLRDELSRMEAALKVGRERMGPASSQG